MAQDEYLKVKIGTYTTIIKKANHLKKNSCNLPNQQKSMGYLIAILRKEQDELKKQLNNPRTINRL